MAKSFIFLSVWNGSHTELSQ